MLLQNLQLGTFFFFFFFGYYHFWCSYVPQLDSFLHYAMFVPLLKFWILTWFRKIILISWLNCKLQIRLAVSTGRVFWESELVECFLNVKGILMSIFTILTVIIHYFQDTTTTSLNMINIIMSSIFVRFLLLELTWWNTVAVESVLVFQNWTRKI